MTSESLFVSFDNNRKKASQDRINLQRLETRSTYLNQNCKRVIGSEYASLYELLIEQTRKDLFKMSTLATTLNLHLEGNFTNLESNFTDLQDSLRDIKPEDSSQLFQSFISPELSCSSIQVTDLQERSLHFQVKVMKSASFRKSIPNSVWVGINEEGKILSASISHTLSNSSDHDAFAFLGNPKGRITDFYCVQGPVTLGTQIFDYIPLKVRI